MNNQRSTFRILVSFFIVMSFSLTTINWNAVSAQSLEERVSNLEQKMKGDDLPGDKYVSEFGGRVMADWTFNTSQSDNYSNGRAAATPGLGMDAEDGFEFRRLRLYTEGAVAPNIEYKVQLDFAGTPGGGVVDLKDAYISVDKSLVGLPLKIGHFKEPFSLNELTSSKYITFMSRSMLSDGFTPEYNPGFQTNYHTAGDKVNVTVGIFTPDDQQQPATSGSYNLSGRVTSPVMYSMDGKRLVHLGAAISLRGEGDGTFASDLEPEVHKGDPEYLDVTIPSVTSSTALGLEAATVQGPLSIQAEYAQNDISRSSGMEPTLTSQYLMASYILTGEHRPYDIADGDFGRIDVKNPVDGMNGGGAWEVAARWSTTDYSEASSVTTGFTSAASEATVITLGTNWYPTSHSKWMLNYVTASQDATDADAQWLASRFQVDF